MGALLRPQLAIFILLIAGSGWAACPSGYSDYKTPTGHCYRLYTTASSLDAARSKCKSDGGYLADIEDEDENNDLQLQLIQFHKELAYIGLACTENKNIAWESGLKMLYTKFEGSPECASNGYFMRRGNGKWLAASSNQKSTPFFCKVHQNS